MTAQLELIPGSGKSSICNLQSAIEQRDEAMQAILDFAGKKFHERAKEFVLQYLQGHGAASGETITDACRAAGIYPPGTDDRAFGPVYHALSRAGLIVKAGYCGRRKGHGTAGGLIWRLSDAVVKT